MRFTIASDGHARRKARLLKDLLESAGAPASLTECQATVAKALGHASWAEMLSQARRGPSPLDEDAGMAVILARIGRQIESISERHGLPAQRAAGVAKALGMTSRERSPDPAADLEAFLPRPRETVACAAPAGAGEVRLYLMQWEESGWGGSLRPDGYSVHAGPAAARAYVAAHWAGLPDRTPEEYERPASDLAEVCVPAGHPAATALAEGRERLYGEAAAACDEVWPRSAGGWERLPGGGKGRLR
jgi:hypothetical protein